MWKPHNFAHLFGKSLQELWVVFIPTNFWVFGIQILRGHHFAHPKKREADVESTPFFFFIVSGCRIHFFLCHRQCWFPYGLGVHNILLVIAFWPTNLQSTTICFFSAALTVLAHKFAVHNIWFSFRSCDVTLQCNDVLIFLPFFIILVQMWKQLDCGYPLILACL